MRSLILCSVYLFYFEQDFLDASMYPSFSHLKYQTNMSLMMFSHVNEHICEEVEQVLYFMGRNEFMFKQNFISSIHQYAYHLMLTGQWTSTQISNIAAQCVVML